MQTNLKSSSPHELHIIFSYEVSVGSCVTVRPDLDGTAHFIGKVISLYKDGKENCAHVNYFCRGMEKFNNMREQNSPDSFVRRL